jgi:hypothetical protein
MTNSKHGRLCGRARDTAAAIVKTLGIGRASVYWLLEGS